MLGHERNRGRPGNNLLLAIDELQRDALAGVDVQIYIVGRSRSGLKMKLLLLMVVVVMVVVVVVVVERSVLRVSCNVGA